MVNVVVFTDENLKKKISPAAGTLPGDSLSGGQSPTARCAGAQLRRKNT